MSGFYYIYSFEVLYIQDTQNSSSKTLFRQSIYVVCRYNGKPNKLK